MDIKLVSAVIKKTQFRPATAQYSTRTKLNSVRISRFEFPMENFDFVSMVREHGIGIANMLFALRNVPGVDSVSVETFSIVVIMNKLFTCDEQIDTIVEDMIMTSALMQEMNSRPVLKIKRCQNLAHREFNLNAKISNSYVHVSLISLPNDGRIRELGCGKVVTTIMNIPGVIGLSVDIYQLRVEKAVAFTWGEIEPQVIAAIAKAYGDPQISYI